MNTRQTGPALIIALSLALDSPIAAPAQLDHVDILHRGGSYRIAVDAVIHAPINRVHSVLSDYAHLERIDPDITSSSIIGHPPGAGERVRITLHSCIWHLCRELVQIEDVSEPDAGTIVARIVPGAGDFDGGQSLWRLTGVGDDTRLHYEATRKLDFWVPPFATAAIRRMLRARFVASIEAVERLAGRGS